MAANSRLAVAAHIVSVLAFKRDEFVPSHSIASSVNTHPTVIRRILAALTRAGIVASEEGKSGGSKLMKCPSKITLLDLSFAVGEDHLFAVHKNPTNESCPISRTMKKALGKVFSDAEKAAFIQLQRVSIADLAIEVG